MHSVEIAVIPKRDGWKAEAVSAFIARELMAARSIDSTLKLRTRLGSFQRERISHQFI